ncbi:NAD-dependent epimerase/dehydratase family protein [Thalassotalea maritima]|uniref:NAD-dependent epimerase/dehydratase family protein n=1 Tax=Thalassotalea maritima TaxID=3242416 RepID=UPI0035283F50
MKILVTGATGFIGSELIPMLNGHDIYQLSRKEKLSPNCIQSSLENFISNQVIEEKFEVVIHLAALAHDNSKTLADFRRINRDSTIALAKQAASNGLRRFVYVSTIGVNGNTTKDAPFTELCDVTPHSDYAVSKYETELALRKMSAELNFELVLIRPPLVYGINAPGNFSKLVKLALTKCPLPFGAINNSRSYISVKNLCEFIVVCSEHPSAANELFLVSDDETYSLNELIRNIWVARNIKSFMVPVPVLVFRKMFTLLGKTSLATQLLDNLEIDSSKAKRILGWTPRFNLLNTLK